MEAALSSLRSLLVVSLLSQLQAQVTTGSSVAAARHAGPAGLPSF